MNLQKLSRDVKLVVRGEMLVVHAKLAFAMRRSLFVALALIFAGLGIVFVNIGLFAYLTPLWGPVWTPVGLALINMALALAAIGYAAVMEARAGAQLGAGGGNPQSRGHRGRKRYQVCFGRSMLGLGRASTDRPPRFSCPRSPPSWVPGEATEGQPEG